MKALIRLADRRGILKGSLNSLQDEALQSLIIDEIETESDLERERMKYTILAGNLHLWRELYGDEEEDSDEPRNEEVDWFTPESAEDIENIERIISGVGAEDFSGATDPSYESSVQRDQP